MSKQAGTTREQQTLQAELDELSRSPLLADLQKTLGGVNFFDISGMKRQETKHSYFLLGLFDPEGYHGWKDAFARNFLERAGLHCPDDLPAAFFTQLQRGCVEYKFSANESRVDLMLYACNTVVIIENKVDSGEHDNQLTKYEAGIAVDGQFAGFTKYYIFLTKDGKSPAGDNKQWRTVSYGDVIACILEAQKQIAAPNQDTAEYAIILNHYIKFLKREVIMNMNDMPDVKVLYDAIRQDFPHAFAFLATHNVNEKFEYVKTRLIAMLQGEAKSRGLIFEEKDAKNATKRYGDTGRRIQFKTEGMRKLLRKQHSYENTFLCEIASEDQKKFKAYVYPRAGTDFSDPDVAKVVELCNEREQETGGKAKIFTIGSTSHLLELHGPKGAKTLFTVEEAYDRLSSGVAVEEKEIENVITALLDEIADIEKAFAQKLGIKL